MDQHDLIQLAINVHYNKGAYALLIGSGISRAASIPTGWEITQELLRQLAFIHGDQFENDLERWYLNKFGVNPGYSELLDHLGKTPTERHNFLRPFFEPTEQEKEEGKKQPTKAHRAIANLVATGIIKVIITTNFDRLLERAIEDVGITPTVIASADAVDGATPIVHSCCTIVKLNGDYLDIRAKNTIDELKELDLKISELIDRIFDEFGLIISGWSGDWDTGLRSALERVKGRRYTYYWLAKEAPSVRAKALIDLRAAKVLNISDADTFFVSLEDKLLSLAELNRPHYLSRELAIASLKRYLTEDKYRIRLHDLVMDEVSRICTAFETEPFSMTGPRTLSAEILKRRIDQYVMEIETLISIVVTGCYWGRSDQYDLWVKAIEKIANSTPDLGGFVVLTSLRVLPGAMLVYAGGMSAVASGRYDLFLRLLQKVRVKKLDDVSTALKALNLFGILDERSARLLPGRGQECTPLTNFVFDILKPFFKDITSGEDDYQRLFERFEFLWSMIFVDSSEDRRGQNNDYAWAPPGRYAWSGRRWGKGISKEIEEEILRLGEKWPPLHLFPVRTFETPGV